jgi:hypothetical protein
MFRAVTSDRILTTSDKRLLSRAIPCSAEQHVGLEVVQQVADPREMPGYPPTKTTIAWRWRLVPQMAIPSYLSPEHRLRSPWAWSRSSLGLRGRFIPIQTPGSRTSLLAWQAPQCRHRCPGPRRTGDRRKCGAGISPER